MFFQIYKIYIYALHTFAPFVSSQETTKNKRNHEKRRSDLNISEIFRQNISLFWQNLNFAKIQQCIHDYFAEIDDVESLELFETILAGTNSILDYLKNAECIKQEAIDEDVCKGFYDQLLEHIETGKSTDDLCW